MVNWEQNWYTSQSYTFIYLSFETQCVQPSSMVVDNRTGSANMEWLELVAIEDTGLKTAHVERTARGSTHGSDMVCAARVLLY